jgi:hypothetical protein
MRDLGFQYFGIGRPLADPSDSNRNSTGTNTRADLLVLRSN